MIKVFVVQASRSEFRFPELTLVLGGLDAMLVGPALKTWDKAPKANCLVRWPSQKVLGLTGSTSTNNAE